jgi:phenylalanyl-tRNA synthetase beta chain
MEIPEEGGFAILHGLGFTTKREGRTATEVQVTVPSWRIDIEQEIDLIEELIRHVGYETLPESLPEAYLPLASAPEGQREDRARDVLAGAGLHEIQTYSFVSDEENAPFASAGPGNPVMLENPLGEPFSTLRGSMAVGLLRSARHNARRGLRDLALFEVGRAYGSGAEGVVESRRVGALLLGRRVHHWSSPERGADFFDGSGLVGALFAGLDAAGAPSFEPALQSPAPSLPFLAPGRSAWVKASDGTLVGWTGVLSASLSATWDLEEPVLLELDIERIPKAPPTESVEAPSRFPGSEVDLTVTHRLLLPFRDLVVAIRTGAPPELGWVEALGRYQGPSVAPGFVKTTLNLRFGSDERSLSRDEVNGWRDAAARRILSIGETKVDGVSETT